MRKVLILILVLVCAGAYGQGNVLYNALLVKPKIGKAGAFESAWKAHVAKFHNGDDKRSVYEILTGDNAGSYHLVDGPSSFADMDKEGGNKTEHDKDFDNSVAPTIESQSGSFIYRFVDSLSYNMIQAAKSTATVYNLKLGKMPELVAEVKRAKQVNESIKSPGSTAVFIKMMPGSSPQMVIFANLKDGFKQLESNYFPGQADKFREAYVAMHGQAAWDKRLAMLQEITTSYETFLYKHRPDLSSK